MKRSVKIPLFAALASLVVVVGATTIASAHGGPGARGGFGAMRLMRFIHDLDLTEAQEVKVVRLRRQLRETHQAQREAMRSDMDAVMSELEKPTPDRAAIRATVDRALERMRTNAYQAVDAFLDLHATLTPEQRAQIKTRVAEVRDRAERRRDRRGRKGRHMAPSDTE